MDRGNRRHRHLLERRAIAIPSPRPELRRRHPLASPKAAP